MVKICHFCRIPKVKAVRTVRPKPDRQLVRGKQKTVKGSVAEEERPTRIRDFSSHFLNLFRHQE